ncbi:hypothetical protein TRP8649_03112 [Pelagimonas phthalicica]|uniref:Acetolactate synthase n=1 Tax=Pelagimonas phthalicica TaxID=1037362 RepID=A0A238JFK0_9RHOB|nr:DUF6497 family protein [Pelagimonas phthalicica]TDS91934.1 hypothetical protein CLV87_3113 [Pelagimonas phthalicica]SMX28984.1 hypothetical protein TRP8649_03112 [Pelagimonas phthalicica]
MIARLRNISLGAPGIFAAPAGGPFGGRGCALLFSILFAGTAQADKALADPIAVPSGLEVSFHDWLDDGPAQRFRFVAPGIAEGGKSFEQVLDDMAYLCTEFALPQLQIQGGSAQQIVVTLMEKPVEFGVMTPDVTQFFESYSVENDLCIWEVF